SRLDTYRLRQGSTGQDAVRCVVQCGPAIERRDIDAYTALCAYRTEGGDLIRTMLQYRSSMIHCRPKQQRRDRALSPNDRDLGAFSTRPHSGILGVRPELLIPHRVRDDRGTERLEVID